MKFRLFVAFLAAVGLVACGRAAPTMSCSPVVLEPHAVHLAVGQTQEFVASGGLERGGSYTFSLVYPSYATLLQTGPDRAMVTLVSRYQYGVDVMWLLVDTPQCGRAEAQLYNP